MRYTSQAWATFCIHVPIKEIIWPLKKSWKLRWRRERTMSRKRERAGGWAGDEGVVVSAVAITIIVRRYLPLARRDSARGPLCISPLWPQSSYKTRDLPLRMRRALRLLRPSQQSAAGAQHTAVRPDFVAKENLALARLGVKPARQQRQMVVQLRRRGAQAVARSQIPFARHLVRFFIVAYPRAPAGGRFAACVVPSRLQRILQNRFHRSRLAGNFSKPQKQRLLQRPAPHRKHGNRLRLGGALQNYQVQFFDSAR